MARGYELMIIAQPDIGDDDLQQLTDKAKEGIEGTGGEFLKARKWGNRKLVYKLKGSTKGCFLLIYFNGDADTLKKLDELLRYNERVLRYQAVKLDKNFDIQSVPEDEVEKQEEEVQEEAKTEAEAEMEETTAEQAAPEEAPEEASTP